MPDITVTTMNDLPGYARRATVLRHYQPIEILDRDRRDHDTSHGSEPIERHT